MAPSYSKYEIRRRWPNPRAAALLVIGMQNHFASMASPIFHSLNSTIALCRSGGIPVIFTRRRHSGADGSTTTTLSEWRSGGDLLLDGTVESELIAALDRNHLNDPVIEASTYNAFLGTRLEGILRDMGVEEVIVTGVRTNVCCETTAKDAFARGFRVFFSVDATATANRDLHEAAISNLAYGFAYLVDVDRLGKALLLATPTTEGSGTRKGEPHAAINGLQIAPDSSDDD